MEHFTPLSSLIGGILIGLSATAMLGLLGRVAGISGIVGALLARDASGGPWRAAFVVGLLVGGGVFAVANPAAFAMTLDRSIPALVAAGLLVGFGSRLGSGCTSGHGVCGMARGSKRSMVATVTFMTTGALTALLVTRLLGGRL
ncbi:YeeE/YedE family protein [Candidatus Binatia bacterium]|nr:YeeE/YedE family protein [Candidatus Binatia bacterium]